MSGHLVLCNWSPRALDWIREVHSGIVSDTRPVVIIHDTPDEVVLPDKQDDPAFNDVYIVKGDPANEVILRRAKVAQAHSVVILATTARTGTLTERPSSAALPSRAFACQSASRTSWPSARTPSTGLICVSRVPMRSSRLPTSDCG
jgi:hypothetical protein